MKKHNGYRPLFAVLAVSLLAMFGFANKAEAIPAFAKKYSAPCTMCHSAWPRLNRFGYQFKVNGYQMLGSQDGDTEGKNSPEWNVHLDVDKANPPISMRVRGGILVTEPKEDRTGTKQSDRFACCTDRNKLTLNAAGTVAKDLSFNIAYSVSATSGIDVAALKWSNIAGKSALAVEFGVFRVADSDALSPVRDWFSEPNAAYYGNGSAYGGDLGMTFGHTDSGVRIYGNPGFGGVSYSLAVVTGAKTVEQGYSGRGQALTAMGRLENDNVAFSLRFYQANTSSITFQRSASGVMFASNGNVVNNGGYSAAFTPNKTSPDETTTDIVANLKIHSDGWWVGFAYDLNRFKVKERTSGANIYNLDTLQRQGASVEAVYLFSDKLTLGVRYSDSRRKAYTERYNGTLATYEKATVGLYEIKLEFKPVQNAKFGIGLTIDQSDDPSRNIIRANGAAVPYIQQSRLLFLWDWAF